MADEKKMVLQRLGGSYQMVIDGPEDLGQISELDEARWFATSVPIETLSCDEAFLKFVDRDKNGRIRADELMAAQQWLFRMLRDRSRLGEMTDALVLEAIDTDHAEGKTLRAAAERILSNLGAGDASEIALAQVRNRQQTMACAEANGDGVIPPESASDEKLAAFIRDVGTCMGAVPDASGLSGITEQLLDAFLAETKAHLAWLEAGRVGEDGGATDVMAYGSATPGVYAALVAVRDKVDDYFALCELAEFDARVLDHLKLTVQELAELDLGDRAALEARMKAAPLAPPNAEQVLRIDETVNAAWRQAVATLAAQGLSRVRDVDVDAMTRVEWEALKKALAPYDAWVTGKKGASVEKLGTERLRECLEGPWGDEVRRFVAEDKAVAVELAQVADLEKLILYQKYLLELANHLVSFPRFFDPDRRAMIELGTLVMDGRRFKLNVAVFNRAAHKKIAKESQIFIMYCDVTGRDGDAEKKFEIASAITAGDAGHIFVGKRGLFVTIDGREWDAIVTEVITNPVGLWEAVKLPFKRLAEFVGKFTEKFSGSRTGQLEKGLSKQLTQVEKSMTTPPAAGAPRPGGGGLGAIVAGGGVAFAALGSSLAYAASKIKDINGWDIAKLLAVLLALVAAPTIIVAVVKLRRRNMSALLEACGWAVNIRMRLTATLGKLFTELPPLPKDATKRRLDLAKIFLARVPQTKRSTRKIAVVVVIVIVVALVLAYCYSVWPFHAASSGERSEMPPVKQAPAAGPAIEGEEGPTTSPAAETETPAAAPAASQ